MTIQKIVISNIMQIKLLQKPILLNFKANLRTKIKTHYETLGIKPTATFNEIKTAYYELTLKYHPDRNKSESAKKMFHEISSAYDVLSKYETRKNYDRSILVKKPSPMWSKTDKHKPKEEVYYSTSKVEKIYDFDKWLQSHYTDAFRYKLEKDLKMKEKDEHSNINADPIGTLILIWTVIAITSVFIYMKRKIKNEGENNSK